MSLDYFNITPVTYIILHSLKKSIHFEYREWRSKSKLQEERNKAQRPVINGGPPSRAPAGPIIVQPPARPLLLPPTIAPVSFTAGQGLHRAIYRHNEFKGPEGEGRGGEGTRKRWRYRRVTVAWKRLSSSSSCYCYARGTTSRRLRFVHLDEERVPLSRFIGITVLSFVARWTIGDLFESTKIVVADVFTPYHGLTLPAIAILFNDESRSSW